jgi:hypothetical protein
MIINPYLVQPSVPAFTGLLDTYSGAAAAYSAARRLSSTYTGALIRVRRSSDNTEQDIGYDGSNLLDESALTTFVGAGNGLVTTWYDQSGNAKNLTQTTAINQPRIVNSGTLIKDAGKVAIDFVNNSNNKDFQNTLNGSSTADQYFVVNNGSDLEYLYPYNASTKVGYISNTGFLGSRTDIYLDYGSPSLYVNNTLFTGTTRNDIANFLNGKKLAVHQGANTSSWTFYRFGTYVDFPDLNFQGLLQEWIIWHSNQASNRIGIQTNINTFYSIY